MTERKTYGRAMKARMTAYARKHGPQAAGERWKVNTAMMGRWVREGWDNPAIKSHSRASRRQYTEQRPKSNGALDPQAQAIISLERYLKNAGDPLTYTEQDTNILLALQAIRKLS